MISNDFAKSSYNNFSFNFKTNSGDQINLFMYDNKSIKYNSEENDTAKTKELTLSHQYGYKFEYKTNGLSEQDRNEISKAMEILKPKISEFMKKVKENEPFSNQDMTNLAASLKNSLPEIKNENQKNALSNKILNNFDELIKKNKPDLNFLSTTNKLFKEILKQLDGLNIYA